MTLVITDERTTLSTHFFVELSYVSILREERVGMCFNTTLQIGISIHSGYLPKRRFILVNSICIVECPENDMSAHDTPNA